MCQDVQVEKSTWRVLTPSQLRHSSDLSREKMFKIIFQIKREKMFKTIFQIKYTNQIKN